MLKRVTFSGFDQWTSVEDLKALYREYPFVEFGFLLSDLYNGKDNRRRNPDVSVLENYREAKLPLSLHVCDNLAEKLVKENDWDGLYKALGDYMPLFDRIQYDSAFVVGFSDELTFPEDKQIILQLKDGNEGIWERYGHLPNVFAFQDNSGGTGVCDMKWRKPMGEYFGYSGGLCPENVVEAVKSINQVCDIDYWIDMESRVRTDDTFDVNKCRKVCELLVGEGLI